MEETVKSVRVVEVVEVKAVRGTGAPEDPTRLVTEYWGCDGEKLAERDPLFALDG